MLRIQLQNFLPTINSAEDIFELFHKLKYPPEIFFDTKYKRKIEDFDFKAEEKQRIRNIYTVFSFEKNLTVFLVETTSLASKLIRYLAKVFSDRYDSVLVVVTKDYSDLLFVLAYEGTERGWRDVRTSIVATIYPADKRFPLKPLQGFRGHRGGAPLQIKRTVSGWLQHCPPIHQMPVPSSSPYRQ